jgi:hypothetical protein
MKTALFAAAFVVAALPAWAGKENYGKADDYGSASFAMLNQCMVDATTHKEPGKRVSPTVLPDCMKDNGFAFLPDARVFGNRGPKCKSDEMGVFHSWCWGKLE